MLIDKVVERYPTAIVDLDNRDGIKHRAAAKTA